MSTKKKNELRPMGRLELQILYANCAKSGWVHGEFSETIYQGYLTRFAYFYHYLLSLKNEKSDDVLIPNANTSVFFIRDKDNLVHTVYLDGLNKSKKAGIKTNDGNQKQTKFKFFFAEAPNTLNTYVYNPSAEIKEYVKGPLSIASKSEYKKENIENHLNLWREHKVILLDFFPFPIIMDTEVRGKVQEDGYTFRKHLDEYFFDFFHSVKSYLSINVKQCVYLITPAITGIHAFLELSENRWQNHIKIMDQSDFDGTITKKEEGKKFNEDSFNNILDGFINVRNKQIDYLEEIIGNKNSVQKFSTFLEGFILYENQKCSACRRKLQEKICKHLYLKGQYPGQTIYN